MRTLQPPLLIRRALGEDTLPPGLNGNPDGWVHEQLWRVVRLG